jgi:hypothetical protein
MSDEDEPGIEINPRSSLGPPDDKSGSADGKSESHGRQERICRAARSIMASHKPDDRERQERITRPRKPILSKHWFDGQGRQERSARLEEQSTPATWP